MKRLSGMVAGGVLAGLLVTTMPTVAHATCRFNVNANGNEPDGGTNGTSILLTFPQPLKLGTFTRPDTGTGSAVLTVAANGTRSIPPNLNIPKDTLTLATAPAAAVASVTGGVNCGFRITVQSTTGSLSNVTLQPVSPYAFKTSGTGTATARLDALGRFSFNIGVSQTVDAPPSSQTAGGSITIVVDYVAVGPP